MMITKKSLLQRLKVALRLANDKAKTGYAPRSVEGCGIAAQLIACGIQQAPQVGQSNVEAIDRFEWAWELETPGAARHQERLNKQKQQQDELSAAWARWSERVRILGGGHLLEKLREIETTKHGKERKRAKAHIHRKIRKLTGETYVGQHITLGM